MKIAAKTWALVVGIDRYTDLKIPELTGAVADAMAFADWLKKLGVPDEQVFIHAAPTRKSEPLLKGRRPAQASAQAIDRSIVALEKVKDGKRLIVYLAGHGIFEADAGRLFLVEEFMQDSPMNMGLELYVKRFLSMPFERQFLFVDGCQNLPYSDTQRQRIIGQMFGGAAGKRVRPRNRLVACFAASVTQRAYEVDGRGAFTRRLLEAIDPKAPYAEAVFLDFDTGESFLDLRKAVVEYVKPSVEEDVRETRQTPYVQSFPGDIADLSPFYSFREDAEPGTVTVRVAPDAATPEVERVTISVTGNQPWSFSQPRPPRREVGVPFSVKIPVGRDLRASCVLRPGAAWEGAVEKRLQVAAKTAVTFELAESHGRRGAQMVELRTVDAAGSTVFDQFSYDEIEGKLGVGDEVTAPEALAPGVAFGKREVGPTFAPVKGAPAGALNDSRRLAAEWARAIQELTPDDVGVETILTGAPAEGLRPRLRFTLPPGGAAGLAGPIASERLVWIGLAEDAPAEPRSAPQLRSLAEFAASPEIEVQPGHPVVRIDLPWGSWSHTADALPGSVTDVEFPSSIGDPPLRVRLHRELARKGSFLFGVEGRAPRPMLRDGLDGRDTRPFRQVREGSARWAFSAPQAAWLRRPGTVGIATARGWSFPFLYGRSLAFERVGRNARVEPLSGVAMAEWDVLLARGLLDGLTAQEAVQLTFGKWEDPLLGLAGAYAVHAQPVGKRKKTFLPRVIQNLRRISRRPLGMNVPDIDLLSAAHTARTRKKATPEDRELLERWATEGAVPVLRWGVSLGVRLIEDGVLRGAAFEHWREQLVGIEESLSPVSVWTAWRHSSPTAARRLTAGS